MTPVRPVHPFLVRATHWVNAFAIVCMILSGWQIFNASPLFDFRFPRWMTLGGWLAGAIAWHFAAMWLLALNGLVYLAYGFFSGHFKRSFLPLNRHLVLSDVGAALRFRLPHSLGRYNAVQRLAYVTVILLITAAVLSGLAIWKPVQFQELTALLGGYDTARWVHFLAMSGIVGFIVVHLALVLIVPKTLLPMITGRAPREPAAAPAEVRS
jgi:thiosulfate reductase cytochrome b subunit